MPSNTLLGKSEPPAVDIINADSNYPVVLVCEHAGQAVPDALQPWGLSPSVMQTHIAWDIGAASVSRLLAEQLGAPLLTQQYSRLVIDCNRPPESQTAMPTVSDGVQIPANQTIDERQRQQRVDEIFHPFQNAVKSQIERPTCRAIFSIHSYTRTMSGKVRPWDLGLLFRKDQKTSKTLAAYCQSFVPIEKIGMNEPYDIDDESDWFVPQHGETSGLPHSLIEICNDLIDTPKGQQLWAAQLATVITQFVKRELS